jgi:hypothetical protein
VPFVMYAGWNMTQLMDRCCLVQATWIKYNSFWETNSSIPKSSGELESHGCEYLPSM